MKKWWFVLPIILIFFIIPTNVNAQETDEIIKSLTSNKTVVDGQAVTNVYVTLNDPDNSSINGSVMISSAVIIGFIGFTSIVNVGSFTKEIRENLPNILILYSIIGLMVALHLSVIMMAYFDILDDAFYMGIIISTIIIILTIIGLTAYLSHSKATYPSRKHQAQNKLRNAMSNYQSSIKFPSNKKNNLFSSLPKEVRDSSDNN